MNRSFIRYRRIVCWLHQDFKQTLEPEESRRPASGEGCVFTYDGVGSNEQSGYSSQGSGQTLIMPVLDNQLKSASPFVLPPKESSTPLSGNEAVDLIRGTFASAAERDMYTLGDGVEVVIINKNEIRSETMPLKHDWVLIQIHSFSLCPIRFFCSRKLKSCQTS